MSTLDNRIAAQCRKIETLEGRIGRLMSKRVDEEEKLAHLLARRNARNGVRPPCPDCESAGTCEDHPFGGAA